MKNNSSSYRFCMTPAKLSIRSNPIFLRNRRRAFFRASSDWKVIWAMSLLLIFSFRKTHSLLIVGKGREALVQLVVEAGVDFEE